MAIKSFGTRFYANGLLIGSLTRITRGELVATVIEVTTHSSPDNSRQFIGGLVNGGEVTLSGFFDYGDSGQDNLRDSIGEEVNCYVIFSDNSGFAFRGIITNPSTEEAPEDDAVSYSAALQISSKPVEIFPTITVSGTLTSDGSTPVVFPSMPLTSFGDRPIWSNGVHLVSWGLESSSVWGIQDGAATWLADQDVLLPTLVTSWSPVSTETGTPVLTGS